MGRHRFRPDANSAKLADQDRPIGRLSKMAVE